MWTKEEAKILTGVTNLKIHPLRDMVTKPMFASLLVTIIRFTRRKDYETLDGFQGETRSHFNVHEDPGDNLEVPQLSESSPNVICAGPNMAS